MVSQPRQGPIPPGSHIAIVQSSYHHHIRFWYLWCCGCPGLRGRQHLTLFLHEFLSHGMTPSRLHIVISFLTHADHVFLGLPRSLVPGSPKRVMELMHEVARCTCPYHLRRRVRRTAVISYTKFQYTKLLSLIHYIKIQPCSRREWTWQTLND